MKRLLKLMLIIALAGGFTSASFGLGIGAWAGYGFSVGSAVDTCKSQTNCTAGGFPAAGANLYLLGVGPVQLGLGASYQQLYKYDVTGGGEASATAVPILAEGRIKIPLVGLFANVGAGVSLVQSKATVSGISATSSDAAFAYMVGVGYELISLGPASIDVGVRYYANSVSGGTISNIVPNVSVTAVL